MAGVLRGREGSAEAVAEGRVDGDRQARAVGPDKLALFDFAGALRKRALVG